MWPQRIKSEYQCCDEELLFILQFAGITAEEQEHLETHGASSLKGLMAKVKELKQAKLRFIDRKRQRTLWKCILWYQDYLRVYRKKPHLLDDLNDDALVDFH